VTLLEQWALGAERWHSAFRRRASFVRVVAVLLGLMCTQGRHTVSNSILFRGRRDDPWSSDYLAFSRAPWEVDTLFTEVLRVGLEALDAVGPQLPIEISLDDSSVKKCSRVIAQAHWMRDPLSPPFRMNLKYGLRYVHVALMLPLHRQGYAARAVSVAFELAPAVRRPGRKASDAEWAEFRLRKREMSLPRRGLLQIQAQRHKLDQIGLSDRPMRVVVDGGYTNRTVLGGLPERVDLIGRTRKDIALRRPAAPGGRKVYGDPMPTPEQMRGDDAIPYLDAEIHYGGKPRPVRYKIIGPVLWPRGGRRRPLRLLIIAPTPYRAPGGRRRFAYNQPAYLLTTDLHSPAVALIQSYFDRWQIEPLHRDLKTGLGVGQAQVYSSRSVERLHSALVAAWSMLTLAALRTFGPARTQDFAPLPAWRRVKPNHRASQLDLVEMLRADFAAAAARDDLPPLLALPPSRAA
jgi:hypothetical protein